jgi:hypothetical protein
VEICQHWHHHCLGQLARPERRSRLHRL